MLSLPVRLAKGLWDDPPPNGVPGRRPGPDSCPTAVALFVDIEDTPGCPKGEGRAPKPPDVPKVGANAPPMGVVVPNAGLPKPDPPFWGAAESNPVLVQDNFALPRFEGVPKVGGPLPNEGVEDGTLKGDGAGLANGAADPKPDMPNEG